MTADTEAARVAGMLSEGDAELWHMREVAHYNGGKEWFGYGYCCIEQPRLYRLDRYTRKDRAVSSEWSVDGEACADLASAIERLNIPPVVTEDERTMLAAIKGVVPVGDLRAAEPYLSLPNASSVLHHWLPRKGLIEARNGCIRLTDLGRQHLQDSPDAL